jgi:sugar lactone lactonase YvrE
MNKRPDIHCKTTGSAPRRYKIRAAITPRMGIRRPELDRNELKDFEMTETATDQPFGELEIVHLFHGAMPTGVSVSCTGRIFVNFPRWGDDVEFTVAEIRDGELFAYPSQAFNDYSSAADPRTLVSVQSIVVDPADRLWILDTGSPMFESTSPGGPKLVRVDLDRDEVAQTIVFPSDVALSTTYLNDVRFDLRRGRAGAAFITDSSDQGRNGLIVVDLATGQSWRRLDDHPSTKGQAPPELRMIVEGRQFLHRGPDGSTSPLTIGSDGIAISADGERLYYCALSSRRWWSVSVEALLDRDLDDNAVAATVIDEGDKGSAGDGMETDAAGRLYVTDGEHNAIHRRLADGTWETVVHDERLLWPDTLSVAADKYLYVTANQFYRQAMFRGTDERRKPYVLFRTRIGAGPVKLR